VVSFLEKLIEVDCAENRRSLSQVGESHWILLANIFSAHGVPIGPELERRQVVAWLFSSHLESPRVESGRPSGFSEAINNYLWPLERTKTMTKQLSKIALAAVVALVCFGVRAQESRRDIEERPRKLVAESKMDAFSGSWLRDEAIERNGRPLPRVTWQVAFDEKTMTLTERSEDGKVLRTVRYNLDGTETQSKPDLLHKFRWDAERQVIQLSNTMVGSNNPPKMGLSITETWQLSDGGKVLKMLRKIEPTDKTIPIRMADDAYSFRKIE
jgi:hypothetical protein